MDATRPDLFWAGQTLGTACDERRLCAPRAHCLRGVCSEWANVSRLRLSLSGVKLDRPLRDFPILVRLGPDAPVFDTAQSHGEDVRFTDDQNGSLAHEIEFWDAAKRSAHIWVRIPVLQPGQTYVDLFIFSGNPQAASPAIGGVVFPDSDFVFHLSRYTLTLESTYYQGSTSGPSTLRVDQPGLAEIDGVAGNGLALDGTGWACETALKASTSGESSTSLWFRAHAADSGALVSFTASGSGDQDSMIWVDADGCVRFSIRDGNRFMTISTLSNYADGQWHQLYATVASAGPTLFIDGDLLAEGASTVFFSRPAGTMHFGSLDGTQVPFLGGEMPAPLPFDGDVDELRSISQARPSSWVKLSYALERPGAPAPVWLPAPP